MLAEFNAIDQSLIRSDLMMAAAIGHRRRCARLPGRIKVRAATLSGSVQL
jgi:hypothetical protein